jgi:hypothetical protein
VLKKLGLVSVGITAGLMVAAPLASAHESHQGDDCNVVSDSEGGNNYGVSKCNVLGQGNGQGNTFNGVEVPGFPDAPELPDFPGVSDVFAGLPGQVAIPGIPG